jgi:hypothetical protein
VTEQYEKVAVSGFSSETIEAGTYPAQLVKMASGQGAFDPYARWTFHPDGFPEDVEVSGFTTLSPGRTAKGMEWARRILGKSTATDDKYGRDIKDKRPSVNWGLRRVHRGVQVETKDPRYREGHDYHGRGVLPETPPTGNIGGCALEAVLATRWCSGLFYS